MFKGSSLSQFSEFALSKLPTFSQPAPNPLQRHIDSIICQCFTQKDNKQLKQFEVDWALFRQTTRPQFYGIIKKTLTKHLKVYQVILEKFAKTIKELVQSRQRSGGMSWLKEMMGDLQGLIVSSYNYIGLVQRQMKWCNCCKQAICEEKRSSQSYRKDIFAYLISTSEVLKATLKELEKSSIKHSFSPFIKDTLNQIKLQMEECCQEGHSKPKKKKKKNKDKSQPEQKDKEELIQDDERQLTAFLKGLTIEDNARERCSVSEEWINSIRPCTFFNK